MKEVSAAAVKIQSQFRMRRAMYEHRTLRGAAIAVVAGHEVEQQQQDVVDKKISAAKDEESKDQDEDVSDSFLNNEDASDEIVVESFEVLETTFDKMASEEKVTLEPVKAKIVTPEAMRWWVR